MTSRDLETLECKLAEEGLQRKLSALQEENERLTAIVNSIPDEVWFADIHKNFTLVNPSALKEFAIASADRIGIEELAGKLEVYNCDGRPRTVEDAPPLRALKGETVRNQEEIVRTPGCGELRHRQVSSSPVRDGNGNIIGSVSVVRDVTERRRVEEALHENQARLELAVHSAAMGVWSLDIIENKRYFDDQVCHLLGIDPRTFTGDADEFFTVVHPDDRRKVKAALIRTIDSGVPYEVEYRAIWPDESVHHIVSRGRLVCNEVGNPMKISGIIWDVTEHRRSIEAAQKACSRFERMCSSNVVGVIMGDPHGGLLEANDYYLNLLGFTRGEFRAGKVRWDERTPDEYMPVDRRAIEQLRATGICTPYEKEYIRKDGSRVWVLIADVLVPGPEEQILAIIIDITERKKAESAAAAEHSRLEQANRELKEMHSQLLQNEKLAAIGQLAAGVAHEINNPVGFVACNFEVLEGYAATLKRLVEMYDEFSASIPGSTLEDLMARAANITQWRQSVNLDYVLTDMRQLFTDSHGGLDRITSIVQNLRGFSRIDQVTDVGEYNINDGVETTINAVTSEIRHHCDIITDLAKVPDIVCNSGQINQVLLNIIVNASQAIESQAREGTGVVIVRTYATDNNVVCEISDDGPGIAQENLTHIFNPFFTTKPVGAGTGLGLSVSHDIVVNKHKGKLLVENIPGKGAKFTIVLPLKTAASKETQI